MTIAPLDQGPQLATDPWGWWRQAMPVTKRWAYLDHAAVAPLPHSAAERMAQFAREASTEGDTRWPAWAAEVERLREGLARWIGAQSQEVALVPNTTYGINMVAEGIDWRSGDNVVIPEGEFPSNHFPWQNQQDRGVELRVVAAPGGRVDLERVAEAIDRRTRVVSVSWVGYARGFRIDLDRLVEIAHRRGAMVFLDAIQALGVFPIDLSRTGIDFLAADGHKWMLGPEGAGLFFVRKERLEQLRCPLVGWNSVVNSQNFAAARFQLRDEAARYEGGSANMAGLLAWHESLKLFWEVRQTHGEEAIAERVLQLAADMRQRLTAAGARSMDAAEAGQERGWDPGEPPAEGSGIVTFDVPGVEPARVRAACLESGVVVSCRGGGTRASVHAYNEASDLQRLADAVARCRPPRSR